MSTHMIKWTEGSPAKLEAGMLVMNRAGQVLLVGHLDVLASKQPAPESELLEGLAHIKQWAWALKPHEIDWIECMAGVRK